MTTIDEFVRDATGRMDKSVETTHEHFNSVRTGRASGALLDRISQLNERVCQFDTADEQLEPLRHSRIRRIPARQSRLRCRPMR